MPPSALTREDFIGLAAIAKARRSNLVNMFSGTRLKFGTKDKAKVVKDLGSAGKSVVSSAKKVASGAKAASTAVSAPGIREAAEKFITTCSGVDNIHEIVEVISGEATKNLIAEVTPIVGVVVSGAKLIQAGKAVAEDGYHLYKSKEYRTGFLRGDPVAAAEAVTTIIKRDLAVHSIKLAQNAAATGGKIAGLFADLGTATTAGLGLANALASLGLELYALGQEIADMRAGNKRLATPDDLDLSVFGECPILGCYLLTCSDTSQVANFFVAEIGLPNWQDRVEAMKKTKMDPMLKIATTAIEASRLQLEGLRSDKGTHSQKGFFARIKSKAINKINPFAPEAPKVDKSRIVGFGSS